MGFKCLPTHSPTMPMQPLRACRLSWCACLQTYTVSNFLAYGLVRVVKSQELLGRSVIRYVHLGAVNLHYVRLGTIRAPGKKQDYASRYRMPMHANSLRYAAQAARYAPHSPTIPQSTTSLEAITSSRSQAKPSALARCNKDMTSTISDMPKGLPQRLKAMPNYARFFYEL